jgi:hypothetical protein
MAFNFDFYVSGLEQAIVNHLQTGDAAAGLQPMTAHDTTTFAIYAGELDPEVLREAINELAPRFPLVLVAYGSGADKRKAGVNLLAGEPIEIEHRCGFVVICANDDARGNDNQRLTANRMIGEVRQLIGGVQFAVELQSGERELLNHEPLLPLGVETILRLPDMTAYAAHFETMFREILPDRRTAAAGTAEEILLGVVPRRDNPPIADDGNNLPGVIFGREG